MKKKLLQFKEQDFTCRGKPNESLGPGSPGQLAGGNEMKQSRGEKKKKKQDGRVGTSHLGWIRKVIQRVEKSVWGSGRQLSFPLEQQVSMSAGSPDENNYSWPLRSRCLLYLCCLALNGRSLILHCHKAFKQMILYELVKFHLVCGLFQMRSFLCTNHYGSALHYIQQALKLKLESAGAPWRKKGENRAS